MMRSVREISAARCRSPERKMPKAFAKVPSLSAADRDAGREDDQAADEDLEPG